MQLVTAPGFKQGKANQLLTVRFVIDAFYKFRLKF